MPGTCPLLVRTSQGAHEFLPRGGRPLGWFEDLPVSAVSVQLAPGDVLVFYTDGLTETENRRGEPFGEERLVDVVQRCAGQPAEEIRARLVAAVETFRDGVPPFDDLTLVVARHTGT